MRSPVQFLEGLRSDVLVLLMWVNEVHVINACVFLYTVVFLQKKLRYKKKDVYA